MNRKLVKEPPTEQSETEGVEGIELSRFSRAGDVSVVSEEELEHLEVYAGRFPHWGALRIIGALLVGVVIGMTLR